MPTISIGFQIQNKGNGFQELILDADKFKNLLKETVTEAEKVKNKMVSFGSVSIGLDALSSAFQDLQGFTKEFTDAYDTQMEVERQLEQVMKNTMDARAEDVQGIKDFCSAQQEIGIVGDEVQLAGAQEMATYLELKSSLKTLIPVMNDMVAQQYGYNHTAENATGIATMLGKVMQGQTSALSRLGYSFDEAQEQILKYGTESERAAVLADVVGESVGGMNRKLAETDSGRMKQLENTLGDVKEQLGGLFRRVDPFVTMASNATNAFIGVQKLCTGVKALALSLRGLSLAGGIATVAIAAIAAAYVYFTTQSDAATEAIKDLTDAKKQLAREEERAKELAEAEDDARQNARATIELNIARLKEFKGSKKEENKIVQEMNDTYGRTMGYFKNVSDWYNTLIANSKAYCAQMVAEAKARLYANEIAELERQREKITDNDDGTKKKYSTKREKGWRTLTPEEMKRNSPERKKLEEQGVEIVGSRVAGRYVEQAYVDIVGSSDIEEAQTAYDTATNKIHNLRSKMEALQEKVPMPVMGAEEAPDLTDKGPKGGSKTVKTRRQEIDAEIKNLEERFQTASAPDQESIRSAVTALEEAKRQIELTQAALYRPVETFDGGMLDTGGWSMQDFDAEIAYQMKLMPTVSNDEVAKVQKTIDSLQLQKEALTVPVELKSIEDYNKAIAYQQKLRSTSSTSEEIARHDEVINRLTREVEMLERKAHIELDVDKITSYREVSEEIAYYTNLLHDCTEEERKLAEQNLPALMKKEKELGLRDAGIGIARTPEEANTLGDAEAAISYYEQRIQNASTIEERESHQRTKMDFEKRKTVLSRDIELPQMQNEISELKRLSDEELTIRIQDIGFDTLADKIKNLQTMLSDLDNPPTEGQKNAIEEVISTYKTWQAKCVDTKDVMVSTLNQAASAFQGMGDAFEMPMLNVAGMIAGAIATMIQGYATATAQSASMGPWAWVGFSLAGIAQLAAMVSQIKSMGAFADGGIVGGNSPTGDRLLARVNSGEMILNKKQQANLFEFISNAGGSVGALGIPKFADGGIVSGPTLSLVGEYAGARSNPEVIAPLNKLKDLIGNDENGANGRVEFEIRGDRLWGVLRKFERNKSRT